MNVVAWTKDNYERSATSRCWSCTPCDAGWEESTKYGVDLPASSEMRAIFEDEMALEHVPDWAMQVAHRMIGNLPMCGHYSFPHPIVAICHAIRDARCPATLIGHYTADPGRKRLMSYYVYCLDAWLHQAPLEIAQAELELRDDLGRDWSQIAASVYGALGEWSERKAALVRRMVQRQRWWIKTLIWPGDRRDQFLTDAYCGDARGDPAEHGCYGNPPFGDPYFAELRQPEIQVLSAQIRDNGDEALLGRIEHSHLCAPKAFRYLEKAIRAIGAVSDAASADLDHPVLHCDDAYPDFASCRDWYMSFMERLDEWLDGGAMDDLGVQSPVKHWLARILRHKLRLYEVHNPFGRLVGARPGGKGGRGTIT